MPARGYFFSLDEDEELELLLVDGLDSELEEELEEEESLDFDSDLESDLDSDFESPSPDLEREPPLPDLA
ncbi:MAG: hypothetical protein ABI972_28900 [Acidobacteriota bacterium]